jgi:hypothetical protein
LVSNELSCGFQAIAAIIVFDYRRDFNPAAVSRTCLLSSPPTPRMATDHTSIYGERCNIPRFLPFSFFSLDISKNLLSALTFCHFLFHLARSNYL